MSLGEYLRGLAELTLVVSPLGFAAYRLRVRLMPSWSDAPARLVEIIVTVGILTVVAEVLGIFSLFADIPLIFASLLIGAAAWRFAAPRGVGRPSMPEAPPVATFGLVAAAGIAAILFAHYGFETKQSLDGGIANFDSLWYHMPFAADMAQSGSTTGLHYTDTVFLNWLYPQNSELLHAVGIVLTGRDTLSLFLNILWLGVALLAAWCIGRPYARGHLTVTAAAIVLEFHTLVVREPGAAKNDVAAAALLLAAVAIFITARSAWRSARAQALERQDEPGGSSGVGPPPEDGITGWPLAAAGLAAGLAAGTKVTVLAGVAALSIAAIALAPSGRRRVATVWWFAPVFAGGIFWYARNLIVAANPIPQVRSVGPIGLPGPDRVQSGRPDFTVLHYLTDTGVWREYFAPGLHEAFGVLWPVVLLAALAGTLIAIARGRNRVIRWMGFATLVGLVAYLGTPLSAAGAEGAPVAFGINVRFVVPAMITGLVLLPLARVFDEARRQWVLLAALFAVLVVTDRSDAIVRVPERGFGLLVALVAVVVPAGLLMARCRGATRGALLGGMAALALAVAAIGYPVQRSYLQDRFVTYDFANELDPAFRWANDLSDQRIGLAGTTAGFYGYGFFGNDLSNRVRYLGQKGPKGAYNAIPTCSEFRQAVNDQHLDYLVTTPFLNFIQFGQPLQSPEAGWLKGEKAVEPILRSGDVTVWKVVGELDPGACGPRNAPLRKVPDQPGA